VRKFKNVKLGLLKPYEKNSRIHTPKQIKKICESIEEFGFINPLLIDENMTIIAGHGRYDAAKEIGMAEVPCIFVEDLTEAQKKAYIIADNKLTEDGGWDKEILKEELFALNELGFNVETTGFEIEDFMNSEEDFKDDLFDADKVLSQMKKTTSKLGDVWQLGDHRLMCGDSTSQKDVDTLIQGEMMDCCITDPPYNVNYGEKAEMLDNYQKGHRNTDSILNDNMDDQNFGRFLFDFYTQMLGVLKAGGAYYIFHAETEGFNFREALKRAGSDYRQTLIWAKNTLVIGRQDYQWKHEPILYGWKDGAGHYFTNDRTETTVIEDDAIDKMDKKGLLKVLKEYINNINATIIYENKPVRNDMHPTMKPVKLIERLVRNSTKKGENVIDFFNGSGSTLMACEFMGRKYFGMELDPKYVDATIKRWEEYTGRKAELIRKEAKNDRKG